MNRIPSPTFRFSPGAHPLDGGAELLEPGLVLGQVLQGAYLEADLDDADAAFLDHHRVVVELVPTLVVDRAVLAGGLVQTHHLRVVLIRLGQIGDLRVYVPPCA